MSLTTLLCFPLVSLLLLSTSYASRTRTYRYNYTSPPTTYYTTPIQPQPQPKVQATTTSDIYQYLKGHNDARAAVGVAPLAWDERLTSYAQWWANQRQYDCALRHSGGPYGENIFWGGGSGYDWSPAYAVQYWVNERNNYDYNSNSCAYGQQCGHYTQIVWRNSKRVGCAKVVCYNGRGTFITCNYDPPGNYVGSWPY